MRLLSIGILIAWLIIGTRLMKLTLKSGPNAEEGLRSTLKSTRR